MNKYVLKDNVFVINDYEHCKTFASFLPALSGKDGKPLWVFFTNLAQGVSSFGVTSKDTPITPFDSATLAYQNIANKSFRSFLKIDGSLKTPFYHFQENRRDMKISPASLMIKEHGKGYEYMVEYATVPHKEYAALIRKVTVKNTSKKTHTYTLLDGLPIFFPLGLSNFCYKELVSLMAAYCEVHSLEKNTPFVKFKTSTSDESEVKEKLSGNAFFAKDSNGNLLKTYVDPSLIFGIDPSLMTVKPFVEKTYQEFSNQLGQTENKLPCAFVSSEFSLSQGETYTFFEVYGAYDTKEQFIKAEKELTPVALNELLKENELVTKNILSKAFSKTAYPHFDSFLKQSYLDNGLRGGFPCLLDDKNKDSIYYLYSRKHGDMERDYNNFVIPSAYYSSGPGNFRDVNQNRRNDLFFSPFVGDYNIKLFFELIQADGQNPLTVKPPLFFKKDKASLSFLNQLDENKKEYLTNLLEKGYSPSELYTYLKENDLLELWSKILRASEERNQASFSEGYWVDHWTYNVDLLEDYSSIYPDKEEELFFDKEYRYFYSPVYVNPRKEKYVLLNDGRVRQYGALNLKEANEKAKEIGYDMSKGGYLLSKDGNEIKTNLASKILSLIFVKFSTLDMEQMGIEMECEKPGWNDAMNGLPGLFGSGLSESVELLRLTNYAIEHLTPFQNKEIHLLDEQDTFVNKLISLTSQYLENKLSRFAYWDEMTSAREELRLSLKDRALGTYKNEKVSSFLPFLKDIAKILEDGILRAKKLGNGILPSYLIHEAKDYSKTGKKNFMGLDTVVIHSFETKTIPPFLEASARALKVGKELINQNDIKAIKESDLYDKTYHFYKTAAALDDAPFEIGRVHAFTKGWLERECNFLHMSYKYLLGLLKGGYVDEFYKEMKTNLTLNMDPEVYGRNPLEASSFIVPTCNPDKSKHGQGFFARLSGANAEFLNMYVILFAGEHIFTYEDGVLKFHLKPLLSNEFFDKNNEASFLLFGKTTIIYKKDPSINLLKDSYKMTYIINGKEYDEVKGDLALSIRNGKVKKVIVEIQ